MPNPPDEGAWRKEDGGTSRRAAHSLATIKIKRLILEALKASSHPMNGWELCVAIDRQNHTTVPRLCQLRDDGLIARVMPDRPGPQAKPWIKPRMQWAYIITERGEAALRGIVPISSSPRRDGAAVRMSRHEQVIRVRCPCCSTMIDVVQRVEAVNGHAIDDPIDDR